MVSKAILIREKAEDLVPTITFTEGDDIIKNGEFGASILVCKNENEPCVDDDSYNYVGVSLIAISVFVVGLSLKLRKK